MFKKIDNPDITRNVDLIIFAMRNFYLNGILAFSPGFIQTLLSDILLESIISFLYQNTQ